MKNFLDIPESAIIFKNEYFFIIRDSYPVSPGHLLIISNELKLDYFALSPDEKNNLSSVLEIAKGIIEKEFSPDGYNIGMNCGETAGQTIFHFHCHLIPRYQGDIGNPRGGVRGVITSKMKY
ncbi:HIT family protein [Formosa sp. PL04]|uniref:HIT family protein n=1 Tax=Formosa sp. PL04 TaxID=3081755 RepID=UPI002980BCC0|nr:HIT family protein [Formosa sp. PL04]MDW5288888.1 HIT family protein [Formosa sp. PL04]